MEALKELEFINKIEDNFPFENYFESVKLIDEAIKISPNSVFAIVEEICKEAGEENASEEALVNLLKTIDKKFDHPLRKIILETAQNIILNEETTLEEAIANMELVRPYPQQYAALSIIYFSADDLKGKSEKVWNSITTEWNNGDSLFEEDDIND
ncbi:MAG: hypothetical protein Q7W45_09970 [Bacteroidota bacterium]|nr:hypothetical protein [Bacteroidota bacterium]MDP3143798.1 hypothetical protein [Bacteroidota bacterium]MDP3556948.1 hypothetical protein [Bacteroidota bacterium]